MLDTVQLSSKDMIDSMEAIVAHLPSGAIRVGLEDPADLKGLATLLDKKFGVLIRSVGGELETQTKAVNKNQEKISKRQEQLENERIKRERKQHDELVKSLRKKDEDLGTFFHRNANFFINTAKKSIDALVKLGNNQIDYVQSFIELGNAGVQLQDGFRSLNGLATEAGQYYKDFAKNLVKMNPTLTKLNATIGNGVGLYSEQYKNLRQMGLSQEEANSAFEYAINQLAPAQLREMQAHNTLTQYIDKTTKSLIDLKNATGKSVSIITAENELKGREARYTTWASNSKNKVSAQTLKEIGLNSPEIMDYLLTGIPTSNIAMMMAGSPDNAMLLQELRQMLMSGHEINAQTVGQLQKKLRPIYNKSQQQRFNRAENSSLYAVAGHSDLSQTLMFTNLSDQLMQYGFDSKNKPNSEDEKIRRDAINTQDNINRLRNQRDMGIAGGFDAIKTSLGVISKTTAGMEKGVSVISNVGAKIQKAIGDNLGENVAGMAGAITSIGFQAFSSGIRDWLMGRMMVGTLIVGTMIENSLEKLGNFFGADEISNNGKREYYRDAKGRFISKPANAKSAGKLGKYARMLGKYGKNVRLARGLGAAGTLAYTGYEAFDYYQNMDDYHQKGIMGEKTGETIGRVGGTLGGAWAGGAAGAAMGAAIGSIIPGIGTALGAGIGGLVGMWKGGELGGDLLGSAGGAIGSMFDKPAEEGISKVSSMNDEIINQNNRNAENVSEKLDKLIDCANGICKSLEDQNLYNKLQPTRSTEQSLVTGIS